MNMKHALALALTSLVAATQAQAGEWQLNFQAQFPAWGPDLQVYPLTHIAAHLTTSDQLTSTSDGMGYRVTGISGTRDGVEITGLWTAAAGPFFGGWPPSPYILPDQAQQISFDAIVFLTADGKQHALYGATTFLSGAPVVQYWDYSNLPSSNPSSQWVNMGSDTITLTAVPEPASAALMLAGGLLLVGRRLRAV